MYIGVANWSRRVGSGTWVCPAIPQRVGHALSITLARQGEVCIRTAKAQENLLPKRMAGIDIARKVLAAVERLVVVDDTVVDRAAWVMAATESAEKSEDHDISCSLLAVFGKAALVAIVLLALFDSQREHIIKSQRAYPVHGQLSTNYTLSSQGRENHFGGEHIDIVLAISIYLLRSDCGL